MLRSVAIWCSVSSTHCTILQHSVTYYLNKRHTVTRIYEGLCCVSSTHCTILQHAVTYYLNKRHTVTRIFEGLCCVSSTHCTILQHSVTYYLNKRHTICRAPHKYVVPYMYGVATISRLLKIITGLFCKRAL